MAEIFAIPGNLINVLSSQRFTDISAVDTIDLHTLRSTDRDGLVVAGSWFFRGDMM